MLPPLTPAQQRVILDQLSQSWRTLNERHLGRRLRPPDIQIERVEGRLGSWTPRTRTIAIAERHLREAPSWLAVEDTLRHEVAHQVVTELFGVSDARPHGELFARACRMLGVDGRGGGAAAIDPAGARAMDRVRKLLALATSPEANEAHAAMAQASRLLLKHNLDLAALEGGALEVRRIGPMLRRLPVEDKLVSCLLRDHFYVRPIWVYDGPVGGSLDHRVLEVVGRPENVEMAEYVHGFLHRRLDALWAEYRRTGRSDRRSRGAFRVGVMEGFARHLDAQRATQVQAGLVWVGDPVVEDFYRQRHPRTQRMAGGTVWGGEAREAGMAEGGRLRIHPGVGAAGPTRGLLGEG
jgi:hypothetical protein